MVWRNGARKDVMARSKTKEGKGLEEWGQEECDGQVQDKGRKGFGGMGPGRM